MPAKGEQRVKKGSRPHGGHRFPSPGKGGWNAPRELQKAKAEFQSLLDHSPIPIVIYNLDGTAKYINSAFSKGFGWTSEELIGQRVPFVPENQRERTLVTIQKVLQGESITDFITKRLTKDGGILDINVTSFRYVDDEGNPSGIIVYLKNITEEVNSRNKIKEEREKIFRMLATMRDGICIIGPDFKMRYLNEALKTDLGEGMNEFCYYYFHGRDSICDYCDREKLVEKKFLRYEQTYRNNLTYDVLTTEFLDTDGAPCRMVFFRDITERNRLEQQLRQAQKMEAIGTLAGGLAHDFNNILTAITGYTSLMKIQMEKLHPFYDGVETIERSARRAAELTQQLLGFARKGMVKVEPVNLNRVVGRVLTLIRETFDRSIAIQTRLKNDLYAMEGDAGQLEQVLLNLCLNARDAMAGGGQLTIETDQVTIDPEYARTHLGTKPGDYVRLQVTDTGSGISPEVRQKIFDPFFTTKKKGSGMGLAMVYGIVKNHGGDIQVYSELGKGSCFKIYLPASRRVVLEREEEVQEVIPRGQETLLIVDDEEPIRNLGKKILENLGYRVLLAGDGKEAAELYRIEKEEIHLVILDMIMPVMGGKETYQRLKEINPGVKVLLSSGYSINDQAREVLEGGAQGFIQKPFDMREIGLAVRRVLDE